MIVNKDSLEQVDSQWAVKAIGDAQRDYGLKLADTLLVKQAVGQQIEINIIQNQKDNDLLQRLAMAYEIAAIEGLNAFINSNLDEQ